MKEKTPASFITVPIFFFLFLFLLLPLGKTLTGAFWINSSEETTHFSLHYLQLILENPFYKTCFFNSLWIAAASTGLALIIAFPLAQLFLEIEFPGKRLLESALLLPLLLPPFVAAIGLKQIFSRYGTINLLLARMGWIDLQNPPDWFGGGMTGIIILCGLHLYPIFFLSLRSTLASIDPRLKEASRNLGASPLRQFLTITLPLSLPGLFAGSTLVFVAAFTDLGAPLIFDFQSTVPTQMFNLVTQPDNPLGHAWVAWTLCLVLLLYGTAKFFTSLTPPLSSKGISAVRIISPSFPFRWGITVSIVFLLIISLIPHLGVLIHSVAGRWFLSPLPQEWTLNGYREIFGLELTSISLRNSILFALAASLIDLLLGIAIGWRAARKPSRSASLLDFLAMIPLAVPGLVLAFSLYITFSFPLLPPHWGEWTAPINESVTLWLHPRKNPVLLLILAYSIHRLPYMVRIAHAGFLMVPRSTEEASLNLGASPLRTLLKITLPLIASGLLAGMLMTFSFSMLDVSQGMIIAQDPAHYPMTKGIYTLMGRITPTAATVACAMGVLGLFVLAAGLFLASRLLGNKMGALFQS